MNIAGVEIGPKQPCRVVAELSNNHNGKLENALRLIEECAEAGADFVKFQAYLPDELVQLRGDGPAPDPWGSEGWTMRRLYEKAQTPHEWFTDLIVKCEDRGIPWFSSVFGLRSLMFLESCGCPVYKIAALDAGSDHLYGAVRLTGKPVIVSHRGKTYRDADMALYCPSGYPQKKVEFWMAGKHGLSYHGTDWRVPLAAATAGARMVEVHVQLDDVPSELESNVSLTVSQLRELCQSIRA